MDTSRARLAARASYARRRHAQWMSEMRECGIMFYIPPNYTGLPLTEPADPGDLRGEA